ncbi:hypothetical protein [Macrococcoides canis]|uniref:hypothetical protein n=1 Tax=Macrococcoides canis TaxID=1855823 RepID=UPI001060299F|nr:hypothetical protein [Macrococcus canis]TDM35185.1 hypothetical protein ETI13_05245 [Macrococcus canis]
MINQYESLYDESGDVITSRTKLFIKKTDEESNILEFSGGLAFTVTEPGTLLIVDKYIPEQIDKLLFKDGLLIVKDGMTIEVPQKSAVEIEKEELLKRLAELENV